MVQIKYIEDTEGNKIFPVTHERAVRDSNGTTLESKLQMQTELINQAQMEIGAVPSDNTPTEGSTNWVTSGGIFDYTESLFDFELEPGQEYYSDNLTQQQCSLGSSKWYRNPNSDSALQRHVVIPCAEGDVFTIEIVQTASSTNVFWNWLTSSYSPPYSNNDTIPSVDGTPRITNLVSDFPISVEAPENAAYLCLTTVDGNGVATSYKVTKMAKSTRYVKDFTKTIPVKLRVAHWNVGHFALGTASDTTITHANYAEMRAKWAAKINAINADIFMCCEYNGNFVNASGGDAAITARDAIFPSMLLKNAYIGTKYSYNMQAIFSNSTLSNVHEVKFQSATQTRYYWVGDLTIGNTTIKVVETHLDWNEGTTGEANRALQIQKLIADFADYDYVIIGADFNVASSSEYDAFASAGYYMANHGYLGDIATYPAGQSPSSYLDNILCKGFTVSNINIVNDAELTDHCAVYADFTLIR